MMNKRHNRSKMIMLLRQAMGQSHPTNSPSLDDESLLLLALGRLDELPEDEQNRVLDRVSSNEQTAELLQQLRDLNLQPRHTQTSLRITNSPLRRVVTGAWVAAACLLVAFGLWRLADPPLGSLSSPGSPQTTRFTIMSVPDQPQAQTDYWAQLDQKHLAKRTEQDRIRDYALLAACTACVILTIPLAWWTFRNSPKPKVSPPG